VGTEEGTVPTRKQNEIRGGAGTLLLMQRQGELGETRQKGTRELKKVAGTVHFLNARIPIPQGKFNKKF